ncbi:hypothetical protein [Micromonospora zhanjiangensis]|uniref:Uncharacterized protein n=1 Tax=Micromonospora zhanjiangensis TaxID=1522057 RepID=A0ABV8KEW2_9ACTN
MPVRALHQHLMGACRRPARPTPAVGQYAHRGPRRFAATGGTGQPVLSGGGPVGEGL